MVFKKNHFSKQLSGKRDPLETPPPFMANAILNFHFDYLHPSLIWILIFWFPSIRWKKVKTATLTLTFYSGGKEKRGKIRSRRISFFCRRRKTEKEKEDNIWRRSFQKLSRILRGLGFGLSLKTGTSQYPWQFLERFLQMFSSFSFSVFLLLQKKYILLLQIF